MAGANNQPLLYTPQSSSSFFSCRTLFFAISLCAVVLSAAFLVPSLIKTSNSNLSVPSLCDKAHDPVKCLALVSEVVSDGEIYSDGISLLQKFLVRYSQNLDRAIQGTNRTKVRINGQKEQFAFADCFELMDLSSDKLTETIMALANRTPLSLADAHAWLSGILTNHVTCLDGLSLQGQAAMGTLLEDLISRARAALAVLNAVSQPRSPHEDIFRALKGRSPSWVTPRDRKLLESSGKDINANVVVAQDGSGNYRTVSEAVAAAPDKSKARYVIYVKKGIYKEKVDVGKTKKNLMIVGDGMDLTIITGSLNVVDGSTTFNSATLAAVGDGFILQDICIQNKAGPEKHQAVALRVAADKSVINRCMMDAYQDTLYAHNHRQFYRDSYITGTVDFIFGNAAVVLQKCQIVARKPMASQKNMVTAQGRTDPNQNTGTSIQDSDIIASPDLAPVQNSFPTFLGRPWKEYSRTVIMQSFIGDHVDPAGWHIWDKDFALKTLFYGEFMNRGPGAGTSNRVDWPGYHVITDPAVARPFTVGELIQGTEWLPSTGVEFTDGL